MTITDNGPPPNFQPKDGDSVFVNLGAKWYRDKVARLRYWQDQSGNTHTAYQLESGLTCGRNSLREQPCRRVN